MIVQASYKVYGLKKKIGDKIKCNSISCIAMFIVRTYQITSFFGLNGYLIDKEFLAHSIVSFNLLHQYVRANILSHSFLLPASLNAIY